MKQNWLVILFAGCLSLCPGRLSATQNQWTGAAGDNLWTNAANWSLAAAPDSTQDVIIADTGGIAVVLNAPAVVGSLNLGGIPGSATLNITGGSLQCYGPAQIQTNSSLNLAGDITAWTLQVNGALNWTNGSLGVWGSTVVGPSGQLLVASPSASLSGAFCNNGTVTCLATNLVAYPGLQFTNNGLLVLRTNLALTPSPGGYPYPNFYNYGTMLVPAGAGAVAFAPAYSFYNQGTLRAETNSVIEVRPSGFAGVVFQDGSSFDGPGVVRFPDSGNFACEGTMLVNGTVELAGGSGYGLHALWTGPGLFRWLSGGASSFTFSAGFQVQMSGPADKLVAGNCTNLGTVQWTDAASLVISSSGDTSFNNQGLFILQTNCTLARLSGGFAQSSFNNFGTLLAPAGSGTLPLVIGCSFNNQGTLRAETNSAIEVRPSGFAGVVFQDGSVFDGAGVVRFAGGGNFACAGTLLVNGTVELAGSSGYGLLPLWTGPGLFRWLSGEVNTFTFGPGFQVQMSSTADKLVSGNCTNLGTIQWTDAASLVISSGSDSSFNNQGFFILQTNCTLARRDGGFAQSIFNNFSTVLAAAGSGTVPLTVGCSFNNQGMVQAETNSVLEIRPNGFAGVVFQNGSVFNGPGLVRFAGGGNFACSGNLLVNGTVELAGASAYGMGAVWNGPGLFRWLSGEVNTFTFGPGFQVQIGSAADKLVSGNCTNLGTIQWTEAASLVISSGSDSSFNNFGQFILQTNCTLARRDGGFAQSTFNNVGTLQAPLARGTVPLSIGCSFNNQGTLRAETNSVLEVRPNGFAGVVFQNGTIFDGAGLVRFAGGGNFACSGTMLVNTTVELAGPSGYGLGTVWTGPGLVRWLSGAMNSFTFGPASHVEFAGTDDKYLSGACTNLGGARWLGAGSLHQTYSGASFANAGLMTLETNCAWDPLLPFINLPGGTVRQLAGQSSFGDFNNHGVTEFNSGALSATGFHSAPEATCRWTLSGSNPGSGFSPLYAGDLGLDGALAVTLANGFTPSNGSSFALATDSFANGRFATTSLPPLSSGSRWRLLYGTNDITLKVVSPTLLTGGARLADGSFQFTLAGGEGAGYEVQSSTNLVNWVILETNGPFSGAVTITDTNAPTFQRRFYRARISD